jgi:hypothetical protein
MSDRAYNDGHDARIGDFLKPLIFQSTARGEIRPAH